MARFVQLHALTVYAPSNLNRDDTGRPKTAKFGGANRLRISSQALKRAIRSSSKFRERLEGHLGERTQRLGEEIRKHLVARSVPEAKALDIARLVGGAFGKPVKETESKPAFIAQLAFISPHERETALAMAEKLAAEGYDKDLKSEKLAPELLRKADTAADIAMFGRMLADNPEFNREAAVQVAHAITTHRVEVEDDFYTAVDDLKTTAEDAGAGFIGELGFGSGVFYLYACIDREQLLRNLNGEAGLAASAIAALAEGFASASPSGKQNSFAAHARASFLRAEKGNQQPRSLAAAFFRPVRGENLLDASVESLEDVARQMNEAYGDCFDSYSEMRCLPGQEVSGSLKKVIEFAAGE